jgi:hypothetical protein
MAAVAILDPVMPKQTGNVCIDSPNEAYLLGPAWCPIPDDLQIRRIVNRRDNNSYCLLELAFERDRIDIVAKAIDAGANPYSCSGPSAVGFNNVMTRTAGSKSGARMGEYVQLFREKKFLTGNAQDRQLLARTGVAVSVDMLSLALDAGFPVNGDLGIQHDPSNGSIYVGKSALYVASRQYVFCGARPNARNQAAQVIRLLRGRGAAITLEFDDLFSMRVAAEPNERSQCNPKAGAELRALLNETSQ